MTSASFLFDTYAAAERNLPPPALSAAICTAIRLGRNSLEHERQAAFLVPLATLGRMPANVVDEDLVDLLEACVQRPNELFEEFVDRLAETAHFSAIRVTLAQLFQKEYGESTLETESGWARRRAIRRLCKAAPAEVWSDIVQGGLTPSDADFLARPDFTVLGIETM